MKHTLSNCAFNDKVEIYFVNTYDWAEYLLSFWLHGQKLIRLFGVVQNSSEQCCVAPSEQYCYHVVQPSILLQLVDMIVNNLQQYWWLNNMTTTLFRGCSTTLTLFTAVLNNLQQLEHFYACNYVFTFYLESYAFKLSIEIWIWCS